LHFQQGNISQEGEIGSWVVKKTLFFLCIKWSMQIVWTFMHVHTNSNKISFLLLLQQLPQI
jgi:hypothetical protein